MAEHHERRKSIARPLLDLVIATALLLAVLYFAEYKGEIGLGLMSDALLVFAAVHLILFWLVKDGSKIGYWVYRMECMAVGFIIPGAVGRRCKETAKLLASEEIKSAFGRGKG